MKNVLTKRDTAIVKGFAILCIVLHNYFHWLYPAPAQNEFDFDPSRVLRLFDMLGSDPGECIRYLLSYFGHVGVQLFLFLSGYGLTVKWIEKLKTENTTLSVFSSPLSVLKKLYPLLLTGVAVCLFGCLLLESRLFNAHEWREIGYKMLFIHTLIPGSGLSVNGPWWFFGLIFQLYLLFPLLFRCLQKWGWKAFLGILVFSYGMIFLFRDAMNLHHGEILLQNAPGHLPEFAFGMLLAFSRDKDFHWLWFVLALVLFTWGNFAPGFFPFTFLAICVITVFVIQRWKARRGKWKMKNGKTRKVFHYPFSALRYFGSISMLLFVVHGYFRMPVLKWAGTLKGAWGHLASGLLYFILVWGIALAAKPLYLWLKVLFGKLKTDRTKWSVPRIAFCILILLFYLYVFVFYLRQNLEARHPDRAMAAATVTVNGQVQKSDKSVMLASFPLKGKPLVVHVEGSFDFKKEEAGASLPYLVLEVPQVRWNSYALKANDDGWTHYSFCYDYLRSFTDRVKGKDLKVFLWNNSQSEMQFRDFTVVANQ